VSSNNSSYRSLASPNLSRACQQVHPSCPYIAAKACRSMHVGGKQGNKNNFPFPFPSHTSHGAHTKIAFDRMQSLESMSDTYPMHDAPPYPRWTPHSAPTREYFRVSSHAPSRLANRDHLLEVFGERKLSAKASRRHYCTGEAVFSESIQELSRRTCGESPT
jgi:hypothetical protein